MEEEEDEQQGLEEAVRRYEKAAGLLSHWATVQEANLALKPRGLRTVCCSEAG